MSTTLRVDESTRDRVNQLGARTQQSADGVLRKALDAYEDALYWQQWREAHSAGARPADMDEQAAWEKATDADYRR